MKNKIQQILRKWEGHLRRNGSVEVTRFSQVSNEIDDYIRTNGNSQYSTPQSQTSTPMLLRQ